MVRRDGNIVPASITAFSPAAGLKFEAGGKTETLAAEQVVRLVFVPVPPDLATPSGNTGVLLANGDFIDGEVTAIAMQNVEWPRPPQLKVTVRSVVFGSRSFEVAKEVVAVDLAAVSPRPRRTRCERPTTC